MSALTLSAKLDRTDSNTTWGFRMHGGKDFGCPLSIQRVTPGSLAHKCGLQVGDSIAKIGGTPTDTLRHKEAQGLILHAGNSLELALLRGGAPRAAPAQQQFSAPPPAPAPAAPFSPAAAPFSPSSQNYNQAARPFPGGPGSIPVAVNQQYNTPLNMYSVDNVMDSLSGQTRNLGVSGSEDGSSGTSTPPLGGSMLHDHNHNHTPPSSHAGRGSSPAPFITTPSASPAPNLPWKVGVSEAARRPSPDPSASRFLEPRTAASVWRPPGRGPSPVRSQPEPTPTSAWQPPIRAPSPRTDPALTSVWQPPVRVPSLHPDATQTTVWRQPSVGAPCPQPDPAPPTVPHWKAGGAGSQTAFRAGSPSTGQTQDRPHGTDDPPPPKWGYTNPHIQSKAFKFLQTQLDSGQDPSPPWRRHGNGVELGGGSTKLYRPSETYAMVQKEDNLQESSGESVYRTAPVRAYAPSNPTTTTRTPGIRPGPGGAPAASPAAPAPRPSPAPAPVPAPAPAPTRPAPAPASTWKPNVPTGPRKMRLGRAGEAKNMSSSAGGRIPICTQCGIAIRGPFVLALDKEWCPDHFNCSNPSCKVPLIGIGFVEEEGQVFCEKDYEQYFAPTCNKCNKAIVGECVNALRNTYHPHCFLCVHCRQPIGTGSFHMEDGGAYCEKDWQAMFQTKCYGCQFPIEPGDRWVEALSQNWHSECFNCSTCQVNLEGQAFFAKSGRPYCKKHAMAGGGR